MKMANAMELLNLERNAACGRRTGTCRHSCSNDFSPSRAILLHFFAFTQGCYHICRCSTQHHRP